MIILNGISAAMMILYTYIEKVSTQTIPRMLQNLLYDSGLVCTTWYTFAPHVGFCGFVERPTKEGAKNKAGQST